MHNLPESGMAATRTLISCRGSVGVPSNNAEWTLEKYLNRDLQCCSDAGCWIVSYFTLPFTYNRVPAGQGKLEKVKEFDWLGEMQNYLESTDLHIAG